MFTECLRNLRTEHPLRVHVSLLIGSAALERSLGDVSLSLVYGSNCLNFAFTNDPVYTPVGIPCCVQRYITALQGAALLVTIMIAALWFVCLFCFIAAQCPSLLRDLLATDELERAFSPVAVS